MASLRATATAAFLEPLRVFAAQKCRLRLVIRSIGLARAKTKLGLANLVTNMRRLVWFETRAAPA